MFPSFLAFPATCRDMYQSRPYRNKCGSNYKCNWINLEVKFNNVKSIFHFFICPSNIEKLSSAWLNNKNCMNNGFHMLHILSLTWRSAIRSEGVNQQCLYHVLLICLAVSGNTHTSVFILAPSQAPLEGQVIAFWLYLFPSAFHFRYLHGAILPRNTLPLHCCQNLTDWSLNKYITVSLLLGYDEMLLLYRGGEISSETSVEPHTVYWLVWPALMRTMTQSAVCFFKARLCNFWMKNLTHKQ